MEIIKFYNREIQIISYALFVLMFAVLWLSCSDMHANKNKEHRLTQGEITEFIQQVRLRNYNVENSGLAKLKLRCNSSVVDYAVKNVKDDLLRRQLGKTAFFVQWHSTEPFKVHVKDVPSPSDPVAKEKIMGVYTRAKDRMLSSFTMATFAFEGLGEGDIAAIFSVELIKDGYVMKLLGSAASAEQLFYFSDQYQLMRAEAISDNKLLSKSKYFFKNIDDRYYLSRISIWYPMTNTKMDLHIDHHSIEGVAVPTVLASSLNIAGQRQEDTITCQEA